MITRPHSDEYAPLYAGYVQRIPEGSDIFALLRAQPDELRTLLQSVSEEQANVRPAPGEWSVKEVIGHVCDTDRIFAYRALRFARGDATPLASYNPNDYVAATDFNARRLSDLVDEFSFHRRANLLCFQPMSEAEIARSGTAIEHPLTVRALLFIMAGHVLHHIESLQTTYKVGGA